MRNMGLNPDAKPGFWIHMSVNFPMGLDLRRNRLHQNGIFMDSHLFAPRLHPGICLGALGTRSSLTQDRMTVVLFVRGVQRRNWSLVRENLRRKFEVLQLYYNAHHPIEILNSLMVKSSICCNRDRGVSMSSRMINSHGPFTFVFKPERDWYNIFTEVTYDAGRALEHFKDREGRVSLWEWRRYEFTNQIPDFQDEHEWWAPGPIHFQLDDIQSVIFREKSPGARIHPIISKRNYKKLRERFSFLVAA